MAEKKQAKESKEKKDKPKKDAEKSSPEKDVKIPCRLFDLYHKDVIPSLTKTFSYKNVMQVPKIEKVVVNMGVGAAVAEPKILEEAVRELESITGQKASIRKAKKAISNFKLREGLSIGAMVTLRKERMYEFLDRLINVALPRVRDFRGLSDKSFDGRGNYTLGVKEQIIFPEINVDKITRVLGMDITIVTSARSDNEAYELLKAFGMPFIKKEIKKA
ncbi:MAG: rplE [Ignavibacteriaceae bacterium]|nr:rplE [Ignavibacteriaceae bacterium]